MSTGFETTVKPSFWSDFLTLPNRRIARQIQQAIQELQANPLPDGHHRKKLKGHKDPVYRFRVGDYRLFYTFGANWIRLLALRLHHDGYENESIGYEEPTAVAPPEVVEPVESPRVVPTKSRLLPQALTPALLTQLQVPEEHHAALGGCADEDALLEAAVPMDVLGRVMDALFPRSITEVLDQPDFVLADTEDLVRFKEGDLKGFLLKLDPEQEKVADRGMKGPALIKGGPGSGKSTVALYRVRSLLVNARQRGETPPRVLFTTYTNALIRFSEQLLEQLVGPDIRHVKVQTADSVAMRLTASAGKKAGIASTRQLESTLEEVRAAFTPPGANAFDARVRRAALDKLPSDFLLDEFTWLIEGRGLTTLEAYLEADRTGRGTRLTEKGRQNVWALYQAFTDRLAAARLMTWGQLRIHALEAARRAPPKDRYDAVIVDEAQDLTPVSLALLVELCASPEGVYLTADASQSLYARGFRWEDIHDRLKFKGRTTILRRNYRTTGEIAGAASKFLAAGAAGDLETLAQECVVSGPQPVARAYQTPLQETKFIVEFVRQMSRHLRLKPSSAAVLVPGAEVGRAVAEGLNQQNLPAKYMSSGELDLSAEAVKVLTLHSAKGLEFPTVVVTGLEEGVLPRAPAEDADEETLAEDERLARRLLFVGMTRAMRGLMLLYPQNKPSPFAGQLDPALWNHR